MRSHTVRITLDPQGNPAPLSADGQYIETNRVVNGKDEIRWISDHGEVEVVFLTGTPLAGGTTKGDATFRSIAEVTERFQYMCTITTPDGRKHGWPTNSLGGGTVEVGSGSQTGNL